MCPSLTAISHPQPLLHSTQAEGTHRSTPAAVSPWASAVSTRTGHWPPRSNGVRVPQMSAMRSMSPPPVGTRQQPRRRAQDEFPDAGPYQRHPIDQPVDARSSRPGRVGGRGRTGPPSVGRTGALVHGHVPAGTAFRRAGRSVRAVPPWPACRSGGPVELDKRGAELLFQVLTEREEKNSVPSPPTIRSPAGQRPTPDSAPRSSTGSPSAATSSSPEPTPTGWPAPKPNKPPADHQHPGRAGKLRYPNLTTGEANQA
jgi:hypothetical protein